MEAGLLRFARNDTEIGENKILMGSD